MQVPSLLKQCVSTRFPPSALSSSPLPSPQTHPLHFLFEKSSQKRWTECKKSKLLAPIKMIFIKQFSPSGGCLILACTKWNQGELNQKPKTELIPSCNISYFFLSFFFFSFLAHLMQCCSLFWYNSPHPFLLKCLSFREISYFCVSKEDTYRRLSDCSHE